jgi:hypothetical protein
MTLKDIMAISGYPGLFKFIAQARNGIIVEALDGGKRMNANANMKVSSLGDIAIFTEGEEVPLKDVFKKIREKAGSETAPDAKTDPKKLAAFFAEVLPTYDRERVYMSDIKKMMTWYNLMLSHQILDILDAPDEEVNEEKKEGE